MEVEEEPQRKAAAALVRDGVSVSLSLELNKTADALNTNPFEQTLTVGEFGGHAVAEDRYSVRYHGFAHSHMDGLTHFAHAGTLYNGVSVDVLEKGGARKLGIQNAKDGIFTRGVLVDIPWLRGVEFLEPGTAIISEEPRGVGGQDQGYDREWRRAADPDRPLGARPAEGAMELPGGGRRFSRLAGPLAESEGRGGDRLRRRGRCHVLGRRGLGHSAARAGAVSLGMPLLDNLDLDPLAREARQRGRWTFLFVGLPLRVPGGTGSPLNPLAIF